MVAFLLSLPGKRPFGTHKFLASACSPKYLNLEGSQRLINKLVIWIVRIKMKMLGNSDNFNILDEKYSVNYIFRIIWFINSIFRILLLRN